MRALRDFDGTWLVKGYEELGSFTSQSDAETAIRLARAVSSCDQLVEYFNRRAAQRAKEVA